MKKSIEFYISTGMNGMLHTLRQIVQDPNTMKIEDSYVKRLSACPKKSVELASEYVSIFNKLTGISEAYTVTFNPVPVDEIVQQTYDQKITKTDQSLLSLIQQGIVPVGGAKGSKFSDLSDDHLIWFYSEASKKTNNIVSRNLASAALTILIEKGVVSDVGGLDIVLTPSDIKSKVKLSDHIGLIGKRMQLTAVVQSVNKKWNDRFEYMEYFYKLLQGDNIINYKGTVNLGEKGEIVTMNATISKKNENNGIKTTTISRPHLI